VKALPEALADGVTYFSPEAIGELPLGGVDRKVLAFCRREEDSTIG
jgi:hypothetical protein